MSDSVPHVVIIGGGFGGITVAKGLRKAPVRVTLLDRRNFHLFQPLLYQVATASLSPANIAMPLRALLSRQKNAQVLLDEVLDIDVPRRELVLSQGRLGYDHLIIASGATHAYFGHDEWEPFAPGLKTIEDAIKIRAKLLVAFEAAERELDPVARQAWLTFVIVGGGPTGVELAGSLGELALFTLKNDFRTINPRDARIFLVEGADRILGTFPPKLSANAAAVLARTGVTVRTGTMVTDVRADGVTVSQNKASEVIAARTVFWAAGVQASPLGKCVATATGASLDRAGRVIVQPDLSLPDHSEIFVIGDLAHFLGANGQPLPGVAQVAIQQGAYVARLIRQRLKGPTTLPPFRYRDRGNMATIGHNSAIADLGWMTLSGVLGRIAWIFIHILYIMQFRNRILVLIQWAWSYFTRDRSARLITEATAQSIIRNEKADPPGASK